MAESRINFEDNSKLPFMTSPYRDLTDEELENVDHPAALERMQAAIPPNATELGCLAYELDHSPGLSWRIEAHFYLVPNTQVKGSWFVVRIMWDDNWGNYQWSTDAMGSGYANADEAARSMMTALFEHWTHEDEEEHDPAVAARREFLKRL